MNSVVIIINYFGKWPEWFAVFLESCKTNPTINWIFHTNCQVNNIEIPNVRFIQVDESEYRKFISRKLKITFKPSSNYKLVDLKPAYGHLHEEEIKGYDFFGYGDIDLIYGNIRKFYTDKILEHDVLSTHPWCISGHFALFRNNRKFRESYQSISNWRSIFENPAPMRFDEDIFSRLFFYPDKKLFQSRWIHDLRNFKTKALRKKNYFVEQFTTPLTPSLWTNDRVQHPETWFWSNGRLTNDLDGECKEFLYLHFMNYVNARYMDVQYGSQPYWKHALPLVHFDLEKIPSTIKINRYGFFEA